MAHYSVNISEVQRSKGENALASAAYNARTKLTLYALDPDTGITSTLVFDYTKKTGLVYSKITAPDDSPDWACDRELLWNKAEEAETRSNAQTARKIRLALPAEFSLEQQILLIEEFVAELTSMGMIIDANIHHDKAHNPHVHLMMTTRELTKNRYGETVFALTKNRDWGSKAFIVWTRIRFAELQNEHLAKHGFDYRVTEKSYKDLGLDLTPTIHEGPARHIPSSELAEENRKIAAENLRKITANPSLVLDKLALNKPIFTKEEITTEFEKALFDGLDLKNIKQKQIPKELHEEIRTHYLKLYAHIMSCPELSLVLEQDMKGRKLYTTTKRLALEERFIELVQELRARNNHVLGISADDLYDAKKSPEQKQAVLNILNGQDISLLQGGPGSGKTAIMKEIVRYYKKEGYTVIGVSTSSAAALQLQKSTGITCKNATLWRKAWLEANNKKFELALRGDYYKEETYLNNAACLTNKHVMIIDEASMMELSNMDYLTQETFKAGAKVIKIGDNNQLSSVGWAGAFKKEIDICGASNLTESYRQQNPLHQQATKLLGQYRLKEAIDIYRTEGNIIIDATSSESRQRLIKDYVAAYMEKSTALGKDDLAASKTLAICTYTNKEGTRLNRKVRELLKEAGVIKGKERKVFVGNKHLMLARGEQIVFTRNFNRLGWSGIYNGEVGTVLSVSKPDKLGHSIIKILVSKANGKTEKIYLNTKNYTKSQLLDYGYAVTSHKLQGASIDEMFVLHSKQVGYEAFNVMMTRHKLNVKLYANQEQLMDALYESLDLNAKKAKLHYKITEPEADLRLLALVKITSKRVNNSFAHDYFDMGKRSEDLHLNEYIEANTKAVEIIRKITAWQEKERRRTGTKPELSHHELWPEFKETANERDKLAKRIVKNYALFKDRIIQIGLNYATIQKHAADKEKKYLVEENQTYLHKTTHYQNLIKAIKEDNKLLASKSYINLRLEIAQTYNRLSEMDDQIQELKEDLSDLKASIEKEANYRQVMVPAFLSRIYREDPAEVTRKYLELSNQYGAETAARMAGKKPAILGKLKGIGLGKFLSFTTAHRDAVVVSRNLVKQLTGFEGSIKMEQKLNKELASSNFPEKIENLEKELGDLKKLLPHSLDQQFFDKAGEVIGTSQTSKAKEAIDSMDLGKIRESNEFKAVASAKAKHHEKEQENAQEKKQEEKEVNNQEEKELTKQDSRVKNPSFQIAHRLDFAEVKRAITAEVIENIFRDYAPLLNPDGGFKKHGKQLFCGTLNINLQSGRWHRFSDGSGGNLFDLIKEAANVGTKRAFEIVAGYAGVVPRESSYEQNFTTKPVKEVTKEPKPGWQQYDKIPIDTPKFDPNKDLAKTLKKNSWRLNSTYAYKDKEGNLLGYVVRVLDKDNKKYILPVSYCYNSEVNQSKWWMKGFNDNGYKPIYRAEHLDKEKNKPVLIVEGEKTADKAAKLLPEYTVISWMGGVGSAGKVNWRELAGREVIIWPDNDEPGQACAKLIAKEIDRANSLEKEVVSRCRIVDIDPLSLPKKWDLADELPTHLTMDDVQKAISACRIRSQVKDPKHRDELNKLADFMRGKGFDKGGMVTDMVKQSNNHEETHKALLGVYRDHFIKTVNKGLKMLERGEEFDLDKKTWSCPIKFMKYIAKTRDNQYMPREEFQKIWTKVKVQQKQLAREKEMDGPAL